MRNKNALQKLTGFGIFAVLIALFALSTPALAQKNELGVSIGVMNVSDQRFDLPALNFARIANDVSYQVNYARRIAGEDLASLHFEIVFAGHPKANVRSSNLLLPKSYSAFFLTPGVKVKIIPNFFLSFYLVGGAGYARFNSNELLLNGNQNTGDTGVNRFVVNYGGGVEVRVLPFLSLRGEARDYYSGSPNFNVTLLEDGQHNLFVTGGVVIRF